MKIKIGVHKIKSVFLSWLLSYLLIIFITTIISLFAYWTSIKVVHAETNRVYMESLNQVKQLLDSKLLDIQKIGVEASLNDRINSLMNQTTPIDADSRIEMAKIINDLKTYKIANGFIGKFYIYFKNNDIIISGDARYDTKDFYNFYYKDYKIGYSQWQKLINHNHSLEYVALYVKGNNKKNNYSIDFMQSLPMTRRNVNYATLVIEMNEQSIQKSIEALKWVSKGTIFIEDKNNKILASTKAFTMPKSLYYDNFKKTQNTINKKLNNRNMVISYVKSDVTDWKYISAVPESIYSQKVKYIYRIFFICVMLCFIIGGYIAYRLTQMNYNPINNIIKMFNIRPEILKESGYNEYDFIAKSITDIISEKEKIYNKLDQQKDVLKANFLSRLIKGKLEQTVSFQDACESYNIKLVGMYYCVILFYLEDFSNLYFAPSNSDVNSDKTINLVHFIMSNIIEDKINEKYTGYMTLVNDMPICLVNFSENEKLEMEHQLISIISEAKKFIENRFCIYFSASISSVHAGIDNISSAYQESIEAIEYKMLIGNNSIILYDDILLSKGSKVSEGRYIYEENQFINCIRASDYKNAKIVLDEIFKNNFSENILSIQVIKCKMFGLINIMLNAISEISLSNKDEFIKENDLVNQLLNCKTINELRYNMIYMLDKFESYYNEQKGTQTNEIYTSIIDFIDNNYQNPELNVSMVANKFDMNIVTLSKFFKKYAGIGMLDYINRLRIEKAKVLTKAESLSVKEIAEKVGFYSSAAFIRVFKKYEGVTPGKLKENL